MRCAECLNEAIERCEVTGVPLCAGCLWYTEDGRRVSERVARQLAQQGITIYSPQTYLSQLGVSAQLPRLPEAPPLNTKHRNGSDIIAMLAGVSGVISIAAFFGMGIALCVPVLPLLPLLLGGVGLAGAHYANNPSQARLLSWIGIASGLGFLVMVLLLLSGSFIFDSSSLISSMLTPHSILPPVVTPTP